MRRTVLIVAPYLPLPADFGGALRIYHLLKTIADTNDVVLLAPASGDSFKTIIELSEICDVTAVPAPSTARDPASRRKRIAQLRSLAGRQSYVEQAARSEKMQAIMDRLFQTRSIDLVQYEFPPSTLFRPARPTPTVFDAHNIEYRLLERITASGVSKSKQLFNAAEFTKIRRFERDAWRRSTVCIATSASDASRIEQVTGQPVPVVPNGVDYSAFAPLAGQSPVPGRLLFAGAMRHEPNAAGAIWFVNEILPLIERVIPRVSLTIAGADPPPAVRALASATVSVTGTVEDIRPYLARAAVSVVPLRSGSGTRLKILEALAARRPVVSTSIGAEGLEARSGAHLLIADSPRQFASAVIRLLTDHELASRLALNGQTLARDQYDWQSIVPALLDAHELAIERFRSSSSR